MIEKPEPWPKDGEDADDATWTIIEALVGETILRPRASGPYGWYIAGSPHHGMRWWEVCPTTGEVFRGGRKRYHNDSFTTTDGADD